MKTVVLIGHGTSGVAFKGAIEMIFGKAPSLIPLSFEPGEGLTDVSKKVEKATKGYNPDDILVVTDLFSGTPYNACSKLALEGKVKDVVAGMSLPLLLDVVTNINQKSIDEIEKIILKDSSKYTCILSEELKKKSMEDDF